MVTLYLAGTSIRLESKIAVGERVLNKYKRFKKSMPKEFSVCRTRKGCFAYLIQSYCGKDVVEQATKLGDENGKIIERLVSMKTEDEENLKSCIEVINGRGYNLLADWLYRKFAPVLEAQDKKDEQEPQSCCEVDEISVQEDEKIRESLLEYLHTLPNHYAHSGVCAPEWIAWIKKQGEQNPAWSEEDEKAINDIMWIIEAYRKNGFNETHMQVADSSEKWIKSLKNRVQPQQKEWSKEDEEILDKVITNYESGYLPSVEKRDEIIKKLKSLRPQNRKQEK